MGKLRLKRVYEAPAESDGLRILADRLWPRGLKKEKAAIALWLKDLAPSHDLRHWFGHDPARWLEFQRRYHQELKARPGALAPLRQALQHHETVTLLYAARDEQHNNAVALRNFLAR